MGIIDHVIEELRNISASYDTGYDAGTEKLNNATNPKDLLSTIFHERNKENLQQTIEFCETHEHHPDNAYAHGLCDAVTGNTRSSERSEQSR